MDGGARFYENVAALVKEHGLSVREAVFVAPPGPSTEEARALATRHVVEHPPHPVAPGADDEGVVGSTPR